MKYVQQLWENVTYEKYVIIHAWGLMQTKPCKIFRSTNSFYWHGFRACSSFIFKLIINFQIYAYLKIIYVASNDTMKKHHLGRARPYICSPKFPGVITKLISSFYY
jgi:hypothetical protein